jgi:uncharacterized protein YndB with AHSA1/START domain
MKRVTVATPGDREISISRVFAARRELVFAAMTTPALVKQWLLGPPGWTMPLCEIDLRVGGAYRYEWQHAVHGRMGMRGVYRRLQEPGLIVCTEAFDQSWYGGEAVVTSVLVQIGDRTQLTTTSLYETQEARDTALRSNMEEGVAHSYAKLDEMLRQQAVRPRTP